MADHITIASGALTADIDPLGAELVSLRDADGRELMTNADPAYWRGRAPILFPIVGAASGNVIRVDGREYPMEKHGIARRATFVVSEVADSAATFVLEASEATHAHYPFDFRLTLRFRIEGATLSIAAEVANMGAQPMPASFGFHPAFAWPLPYGHARSEHAITFGSDEPDALRLVTPDGTMPEERRASPLETGRTLHLADDLFTRDALIWDAVRSDHVTYGADTGPRLRVDFPDTLMLGIWTKPGAAFVCVEPWHGRADPAGYTGELRDKPGVFEVAPGDTKRIGISVTLVS